MKRLGTATDLTKYDPDKGLKTIAVAEAAEKHFARAKDATQLTKAIRGKLEAQADFVHWWDHVAERGPRGRPKNSRRSAPITRPGQDGMPERYVIDRWRKRLGDEDSFEATYQAACARYIKILEQFEAGAHVSQNSGENEWYTPEAFIEAARTVLGSIDLDPASSAAANRIVKATAYYSLKDNGLEQQWSGRVWLNPPYAQPLVADFASKLAASVTAGDVSAAVVLVNNATDTEWFATIVDVAVAICFPTGRVRFWSPGKESATPLQGQAVVYIGDDMVRFCDTFRSFGFVVEVRG